MPSNANETNTKEIGIRNHAGELFPYNTVADFLKSDDFLNIIIQCGQREAAMEAEVKSKPDDIFWQARLTDARQAKFMAINARSLSQFGGLR